MCRRIVAEVHSVPENDDDLDSGDNTPPRKLAKKTRQTTTKEALEKSEKRRKRKASNLVANEDGGEEPAIGESGEETGMLSAEVIAEADKKRGKKGKKRKAAKEEEEELEEADKKRGKKRKAAKEEEEESEEVLERRSFGSGELIEELRVGDPHGNLATLGDSVGVRYTCWLMETKEMFHSNDKETHPFRFVVGGNKVYRGWNLAVCGEHYFNLIDPTQITHILTCCLCVLCMTRRPKRESKVYASRGLKRMTSFCLRHCSSDSDASRSDASRSGAVIIMKNLRTVLLLKLFQTLYLLNLDCV